MYSAILMMALTTGGDATMSRHHGGGCGASSSCSSCGSCGASYSSCGSCGAGYSSGCSTCGAGYSGGCSTCGHGYGYAPSSGCSTCASGMCSLSGAGVQVVSNEAPATIIVSLPADAKLMIDDEATSSTSDQRVFVSPNLPTGKEFHYTLKAEIVVNGKPVVVTERVAVKAGEESRITLSAPSGVAAR